MGADRNAMAESLNAESAACKAHAASNGRDVWDYSSPPAFQAEQIIKQRAAISPGGP
jgi:hypothetical protein